MSHFTISNHVREVCYNILVVEETSPSTKLTVKGETMGEDARRGSTINITCSIYWPSKIQWSWEKGNKRITKGTTGARIEWKGKNRKIEENHTERTTQLIIKDMKYEDKGNYRCVGRRDLGRILVNMSTMINVGEWAFIIYVVRGHKDLTEGVGILLGNN